MDEALKSSWVEPLAEILQARNADLHSVYVKVPRTIIHPFPLHDAGSNASDHTVQWPPRKMSLNPSAWLPLLLTRSALSRGRCQVNLGVEARVVGQQMTTRPASVATGSESYWEGFRKVAETVTGIHRRAI